MTFIDIGSIFICLILFACGFGNPRKIDSQDDADSNLSGSIGSQETEELGTTPILSNAESHRNTMPVV